MTEDNAYLKAGVDIQAGNQAVEAMRDSVTDTYTEGVLAGLGGFGSAFTLGKNYQEPVLIAGADGVGTKLLLAIAAGRHETIGQDLVGMVVNDILAQGAQPAFMLDYLAVDKMRPEVVAEIVGGIAKAAKTSGVALIGGESAELPGLYAPRHYDLAAFAVGVAERAALLKTANVQEGDVLIGLPASGIHSNGYSLVRQVLGIGDGEGWDKLSDELQQDLLTPTALYIQAVWPLIAGQMVHSIAHITGGGFTENIPRALPDHLAAQLSWGSWPVLPIFHTLQQAGQLSLADMLLTFNNGLGMILTVAPEKVDDVLAQLTDRQQAAYVVGKVVARQNDAVTYVGEAPWL
jgi:phosphoribosylformylglycinamidine cyclo-ligase